ncbi:MAG: polysaccharide biosynthesis protein [Candidatus Muiribacteriota bacterium]
MKKIILIYIFFDILIFLTGLFTAGFLYSAGNIAVGDIIKITFIRIIFLFIFKIYFVYPKYFNLKDVSSIFYSLTTSSILLYFSNFSNYDSKYIIIDTLIIFIFLSGFRIWTKNWFRGKKGFIRKKIIIYGAGDAGDSIATEIDKHPEYGYEITGFLDDDKRKKGKYLHNKKILGGRKKIKKLKNRVDEIIVALPSADSSEITRISAEIFKNNIKFRVLPSEAELIDGSVSLKNARDFDLNDILRKSPHKRNLIGLKKLIKNKTILITGAGGSIGYELLRQCVEFEPENIIACGHGENSIFQIEKNLLPVFSNIKLCIADIQDKNRIKQLIKKYKVNIVFHTAAHKHVNLTELNPCEAVKNNICGSLNIFDEAGKNNVEKVIFISTDKAVLPQSIMGKTKRVCEKALPFYRKKYKNTVYAAVRFGNVIGSRGSVIPLWIEQIRRGGPLTVTHPEVKRYFMSIGEAVQLTLEAAFMASETKIYILDMGRSFKILDIAEKLIKLYGKNQKIKIHYTGLKKGEKMEEDLVYKNEEKIKTKNNKIFAVPVSTDNNYISKTKELCFLADKGEEDKVHLLISELI